MQSATPPASAVRSIRTWLPLGLLGLDIPGWPGSHVPVKLLAYSRSTPSSLPPKIARRCGSAPRQDVCHFHPHIRPQGPIALAEVEARTRVRPASAMNACSRRRPRRCGSKVATNVLRDIGSLRECAAYPLACRLLSSTGSRSSFTGIEHEPKRAPLTALK